MSSPVLYRFELSVWSAVAELAVAELDLTDKVEIKDISLLHGENFNPEFVKINENATLPTLVAPDGTVYKNTTDVVNYLASIAPVKVKTSGEITALTHDASIDPNFALLSARNEEELNAKINAFPKAFVENRHAGLTKWAATPEAKPYESIYTAKLAGSNWLISLYTGTASAEVKADLFAKAQATWDGITVFFFETLPAKLPSEGPFFGGDRPDVDDFHVAARLAHLASLFGATKTEEVLEAYKKGFGGKEVPAPVVKYFEAWSVRESWKKVYAKTLH